LIKNRKELAKFHNNSLILSALEAALDSVRPETLLRQAVRFDEKLSVRDIYGNVARFQKFDNIYVVGAGKATAGMADALYSIFKGKITAGAINVPLGAKIKSRAIAVTNASHPVPSRSGLEGTRKIIDVLGRAGEGDLVFVLISGGGSAMMPMPASDVSLRDKQRITSQLLRSGASIHEINTVRKHLSAVKGGQLLRYVSRSCDVVSLILSDVVDDDIAAIASGPTCPDNSTFKDAKKILKKYKLDSSSAAEHINRGAMGEIEETPKPGDPVFSNVHNMIIGNNVIACKGAVKYLKLRGFNTAHLGSRFDGRARDFGRFLARLASDLGNAPFAVVAGGETTVTLNKSRNGTGGRNQEVALACAIDLRRQDIAVACMGTDGIDGNSDAAGALVSAKAISVAKRSDLKKYLDRHNSYHALKKMHSLIFTGNTGTNVNDITVVIGQD